MRVKPNLLDALKRLRNPDEEVRLWIDAICIQQVQKRGDNPEKSKQISMMTDIFRKAEQVKVWLGEPRQGMKDGITEDNITPEDVKKAVKYIDMLGNLDDTNHIAGVDQGILDKAGMYDLEPLFKLLRRGWFSRRWIVQVSCTFGEEISILYIRKAILTSGTGDLSESKRTSTLRRRGRKLEETGLCRGTPGTSRSRWHHQ